MGVQGKKSMKVAYLLDIFPKITETFILNEILAMHKKGVEIQAFAYKDEKESVVHPRAKEVSLRYFFKASLWDKLRAHAYWIKRDAKRYFKAWGFVTVNGDGIRKLFVWDLMDTVIVDQTRPDHLHAHFGDAASNTAMLIHVLSGTPFTFTSHSYEIFQPRYDNFRIKSSLAKKHVTISRFNLEYIRDRFDVNEDWITVVHCGVDLDRLKMRAGQGRSGFIVSIARLFPEKGIDVLLGACGKLKKAGVPFECLIAGEGPERPALEKLVRTLGLEREVRMPGNQTQEEVFRLLQEAMIKVLPSRALETMGVALMEAMAIGVPVVAPRLNGVPELVEDGECGFLVDPNDVDTMADRLRQLLTDEALRTKFRETGYRKVLEEFDLDKETDKLLTIWRA